jgi:hypothetical protein
LRAQSRSLKDIARQKKKIKWAPAQAVLSACLHMIACPNQRFRRLTVPISSDCFGVKFRVHVVQGHARSETQSHEFICSASFSMGISAMGTFRLSLY